MQLAAPAEAPPSLGSYLEGWLAHMAGRVRVKTWQGYEGVIRLYAVPALGEVPLTELSPLHLQALYASLLSDPDRPLSGGTVLNLHLVLTQALSQAVRWGYLSSNPAAGAQPPRPRRAGENIDVYSGGSDPASVVNPAAVDVMAEVGIDISSEFPKPWTDEVVRAADVIVTMGCGDSCPIFPGKRYLDWEVGDPKDLPIDQVRPIRDEIGNRVRAIMEELGIPSQA